MSCSRLIRGCTVGAGGKQGVQARGRPTALSPSHHEATIWRGDVRCTCGGDFMVDVFVLSKVCSGGGGACETRACALDDVAMVGGRTDDGLDVRDALDQLLAPLIAKTSKRTLRGKE